MYTRIHTHTHLRVHESLSEQNKYLVQMRFGNPRGFMGEPHLKTIYTVSSSIIGTPAKEEHIKGF